MRRKARRPAHLTDPSHSQPARRKTRSFRRRLLLGAAVPLGVAPHLADVSRLPNLPNLPGVQRLAGGAARPASAQEALPGSLALLAADGALWVVRPGGERVRLALGTGGWLQDPSWSPDGSLLTYTHIQFRPATGATSPGGVPWPSGEVFGVRPDAPGASGGPGAPELVIRRTSLNETLVSATWAPDGLSLYAVRNRPAANNLVESALVRYVLASGETAVLPTLLQPTEVTAGPDGSLAVTGETGPPVTGVPTVALLVHQPDGVTRELVSTAGTPSLSFISLPRFSPDGGRLAFAAGAGPEGFGSASGSSPARNLFAVPAARAHGFRGWPWIADLSTGAVRRLATPGHDDLTGIAWLPPGADGVERLLILDAEGVATVSLADGTVTRLPGAAPGLTGIALALQPVR